MSRAPSIAVKLKKNVRPGDNQGHTDGEGRIPATEKEQNGEAKDGVYGGKMGGRRSPGLGKGGQGAPGPASSRKTKLRSGLNTYAKQVR